MLLIKKNRVSAHAGYTRRQKNRFFGKIGLISEDDSEVENSRESLCVVPSSNIGIHPFSYIFSVNGVFG